MADGQGNSASAMSGSVPPGAALPRSVLPGEVARFDQLAAQWWDPAGPMRPLHAMNPLRVGWIGRHIPAGAAILDVGCGAGLAAEALARLGHPVLGLDAAPEPVAAAIAHAAGSGLPLEYRVGAAEDLVAEGRRFPVVTALEVIEHVADPAAFLKLVADLLEPGGQAVISTLNRTTRSFVVAKLGAEYVLRLLPVGTHDWRRFVTPQELAAQARAAGLRLTATTGMTWSATGVAGPGLAGPGLTGPGVAGRGTWSESRDLSVNYIALLAK